MNWVYDDGGRAAAGFLPGTDDCFVRAISIFTGRPYIEVYADVARACELTPADRISSPEDGVYPEVSKAVSGRYSWHWTRVADSAYLHPAPVHLTELPLGPVLVKLPDHFVAVLDRVQHDTWDAAEGGRLLVEGYWTP